MTKLNMYDLLLEITKHCSFNPKPELLAEFANRLMDNKIVTLTTKSNDVDEITYTIVDVETSENSLQ